MEKGITNRAKISNKQCTKARLKYLQRARLSPVGMLEWQKHFLGDWTCNDLSDENPQGTPGSVFWSTRAKDAVDTIRFLAGNSTTFFPPFLVLRLLTVGVTETNESFYIRIEFNQGLVWNTNLASVSLFCSPIWLPWLHVKTIYPSFWLVESLSRCWAFPLKWPVTLLISWNKRKFSHNKSIQLLQDWFGIPTWPQLHFFWYTNIATVISCETLYRRLRPRLTDSSTCIWFFFFKLWYLFAFFKISSSRVVFGSFSPFHALDQQSYVMV